MELVTSSLGAKFVLIAPPNPFPKVPKHLPLFVISGFGGTLEGLWGLRWFGIPQLLSGGREMHTSYRLFVH